MTTLGEQQARMRRAGENLDLLFNGDARGVNREMGYVLLVFPFGVMDTRCRIATNVPDSDALAVLRSQVEVLEAMGVGGAA